MDLNFTVVKKLPDMESIIEAHPLSEDARLRVEKDRAEVRDIIAGRDARLLFITGPCSAWPREAVIEYARRLKKVADEVAGQVKVVMRVYTQKPRTLKGWPGPMNQPDPYQAPDVAKGTAYCRAMMVEVVEMGLPVADEMVFIQNAKGFHELLSWVAVGARSVENQGHRFFASASMCAVGMKNGTSGAIDVAMNAIAAAAIAHHFPYDGHQVESKGNRYAHLVLRGGGGSPNYSLPHLREADALFKQHKIEHPAIIIDASHDNSRTESGKIPAQQAAVVREVLALCKENEDARRLVKGFMIESFLKEGSQKIEQCTTDTIDRGGLSVTDPCLGWEETEALIRDVARV